MWLGVAKLKALREQVKVVKNITTCLMQCSSHTTRNLVATLPNFKMPTQFWLKTDNITTRLLILLACTSVIIGGRVAVKQQHANIVVPVPYNSNPVAIVVLPKV